MSYECATITIPEGVSVSVYKGRAYHAVTFGSEDEGREAARLLRALADLLDNASGTTTASIDPHPTEET